MFCPWVIPVFCVYITSRQLTLRDWSYFTFHPPRLTCYITSTAIDRNCLTQYSYMLSFPVYPFYTSKLNCIQYNHHIATMIPCTTYTHQKTTTFQKVYTNWMPLLICLSVLSALVPLIISGLHIWRVCPVHIPQATTLWPLNFCLLGNMYLFAFEGSHAERNCSYSTLKLDAALKGWLVQCQHCCIASIAVGYRFLLAKWFRESMPSICPLLLIYLGKQ